MIWIVTSSVDLGALAIFFGACDAFAELLSADFGAGDAATGAVVLVFFGATMGSSLGLEASVIFCALLRFPAIVMDLVGIIGFGVDVYVVAVGLEKLF